MLVWGWRTNQKREMFVNRFVGFAGLLSAPRFCVLVKGVLCVAICHGWP
jgi:hypothetical protein